MFEVLFFRRQSDNLNIEKVNSSLSFARYYHIDIWHVLWHVFLSTLNSKHRLHLGSVDKIWRSVNVGEVEFSVRNKCVLLFTKVLQLKLFKIITKQSEMRRNFQFVFRPLMLIWWSRKLFRSELNQIILTIKNDQFENEKIWKWNEWKIKTPTFWLCFTCNFLQKKQKELLFTQLSWAQINHEHDHECWWFYCVKYWLHTAITEKYRLRVKIHILAK